MYNSILQLYHNHPLSSIISSQSLRLPRDPFLHYLEVVVAIRLQISKMAVSSHALVNHLDPISLHADLIEEVDHTVIISRVRTGLSSESYVGNLGDVRKSVDGVVSAGCLQDAGSLGRCIFSNSHCHQIRVVGDRRGKVQVGDCEAEGTGSGSTD